MGSGQPFGKSTCARYTCDFETTMEKKDSEQLTPPMGDLVGY